MASDETELAAFAELDFQLRGNFITNALGPINWLGTTTLGFRSPAQVVATATTVKGDYEWV